MFRYFFIVVALTASLVGCAAQDEITLTAYKTLETSAITYDAVMSAASDMHTRGSLSDADWNRLKDKAAVYYDAYQMAVEAFATYMRDGVKEGESERAYMDAVVDVMMVALRTLVETAVTLGVEVKEAQNE